MFYRFYRQRQWDCRIDLPFRSAAFGALKRFFVAVSRISIKSRFEEFLDKFPLIVLSRRQRRGPTARRGARVARGTGD
jgi:hypothetical protein